MNRFMRLPCPNCAKDHHHPQMRRCQRFGRQRMGKLLHARDINRPADRAHQRPPIPSIGWRPIIAQQRHTNQRQDRRDPDRCANRRPSSATSTGTRITCSAVINALRLTVVYCNPIVCVAYPSQSSTPSSIAASQSRRPNRRKGKNKIAAIRNRAKINWLAGKRPSAALVTTNVVPQRKVVSDNNKTPRAACRGVSNDDAI